MFDLLRSVGNRGTWQPAHCGILMFSRQRLSYRAAALFCWHEVPPSAIHSQQIGHHFSSYGQRRSISISFLLFGLIHQSQLMVLSRCQLSGFHQHSLDMLVALFGKRGADYLVSGAFLVSAEPAVTDSLSDRPEARDIPHLQGPGKRGN